MKSYRKSRKSYPDGVLLIADNGGKTVDRYTVLYTPYTVDNGMGSLETWFPYIGMSASPYHPQGFCQHGELPYRYSVWGTNQKVLELADLPEDCQKVVRGELAEFMEFED
jgi:hypothetical protein